MTTDQFIELVSAVIWPALIAGVFYFLRDEIKHAFPRITKAGWSGLEFAPEQTPSTPTGVVALGLQTAAPQTGAPSIQSSNSELKQFISSITALVAKDQLDPVIQYTRSGLADKKITEPTELNEALLYYSAALAVTLAHETNYRTIFGSQLQLLMQMDTDAGVEPTAARALYDETKSRYPEAYRSIAFENWLSFFQQARLITTAPNGNFVLTSFGRGFLKYVRDKHLLAVFKPF